MNKFAKLSGILTTVGAALPLLASAQALPSGGPTGISGVFDLVCLIFGYLFFVLILATIFFVIMAAFKYLTAGGDPEKVKAASHQLLFAAVAIVVGILAKVLPSIAASIIGITIPAGC